ncbi:MAG: hypothetical protein HUU47_08810 [Bacteroidetes bacterium]|nr:hypothetical protein [Bacteroidota bacterium]
MQKTSTDLEKNFDYNIQNLIIGNEIDPEGFIQVFSLFNGINHQYEFYANFKNNTEDSTCVNVGNLTANSQNVPVDSVENNNYKLSLVSGTPETNNWIGSTITINIAGNSGFVPQNIIHPNLNEFTTFNLFGVSGLNNDFNKNDSLLISWNAGSTSNTVIVEIEFIKDNSNQNNQSSSIKKYVQVTDNGSYKIAPSMLSYFPDNSICLVNIYRGNYENYTASNDKHIGVLSYSKASKKIHLLN